MPVYKQPQLPRRRDDVYDEGDDTPLSSGGMNGRSRDVIHSSNDLLNNIDEAIGQHQATKDELHGLGDIGGEPGKDGKDAEDSETNALNKLGGGIAGGAGGSGALGKGYNLDVYVVLAGKEQALPYRELAEAFLFLDSQFKDVRKHING